jgi:AcrR family transcriptional regulator
VSTNRKYESERRSQQALETRRAIRAAARQLFERDGFAGTTVSAIAAAASVSVPTVYAVFGSKGAILREMMDELEAVAVADGDPAADLFAEPDPRRQLEIFVRWIRTLFERGAPLLRAARSAQGDVNVVKMIDTGNQRRLEGTTLLADAWHQMGALRPNLSARDGAHTLWLLTSGELYLNAADILDWSADDYERWLVDTAAAALFADLDA